MLFEPTASFASRMTMMGMRLRAAMKYLIEVRLYVLGGWGNWQLLDLRLPIGGDTPGTFMGLTRSVPRIQIAARFGTTH
jgi:hypothetical protein